MGPNEERAADAADDLYGRLEALLQDFDAFLLEYAEVLPRRTQNSIRNGRAQAMHLVTPSRLARRDLEIASTSTARLDRPPEYDAHEIAMTKKLIAAGHLPADATPADFRRIQEERRADMAKIKPLAQQYAEARARK